MTAVSVDWGAVNWGSFPDWVAAIGTVGALVAAVLVFAFELAHRRTERKDAEKDQARQLAAWIVRQEEAPLTSNRSPVPFRVRIINRSNLPVYDCLVRLEWPGDPAAHHHILGTVAPDFDETRVIGITWSQAATNSWPAVSLGFTDAAGRAWRQYGAGKLEPGYWPAPTESTAEAPATI